MKCILLAAALVSGAQAKTVFEAEFAPHQGMTPPMEQPLRQEICLNGAWQFQGVELSAEWRPNQGVAPKLPPAKAEDWYATKIKIPSPWNINGYKRSDGPDHHDFPSYPASWEKYKMGWMKKSVAIPEYWSGKRLFLHFEAAAGFAEIYVNGKKVCENFDLFLPFEADITEALFFRRCRRCGQGVADRQRLCVLG